MRRPLLWSKPRSSPNPQRLGAHRPPGGQDLWLRHLLPSFSSGSTYKQGCATEGASLCFSHPVSQAGESPQRRRALPVSRATCPRPG